MGFFDGMASGLVSGIANLFGGDAANKANARMAQQQMDFQERMRATQYQTTVDDLQKAGLNPMLAYSQGGAGTPVGATATMQNVAGPAVDNAISSAARARDIELKDQQTTNVVADTTLKESNAKLNDALAKKAQNEAVSELLRQPGIDPQIKNIIKQGALLDAQAYESNARAGAAKANMINTEMDTLIREAGDLPQARKKGKYFETAPYNPYFYEDALKGVNSAVDAVGTIRPKTVIHKQK